MLKLTWPRAAAWRIGRHHLDRRAPAGSMLSVASRVCGLHAQVMSSAGLAVWARAEGIGKRDVTRAVWEDRTLVKTWAMRGTLHLLPAAEYPMWHAALDTSPRYRRPAIWRRLLDIDLDELDRLTEAIGSVLHGRILTREELVREVGQSTGSPALAEKLVLNSWGTFLKPAAFSGRLCFAPSVGQRVRFTHPYWWLRGKRRPVDPEAAAAAITRRYLSAYAPATTDDFAKWWGGGMLAIRQWMASLGDEVTPVEIGGSRAWMLADDARQAREASPGRSVRLLPAFDPYVVAASRHVAHLLPGDLRARVYRPQGWISPVLLVNGFLQGVWRHEVKGSRIEVAIEPFVKLPPWVRRAAAEEAERLARFFEAQLTLSWK